MRYFSNSDANVGHAVPIFQNRAELDTIAGFYRRKTTRATDIAAPDGAAIFQKTTYRRFL